MCFLESTTVHAHGVFAISTPYNNVDSTSFDHQKANIKAKQKRACIIRIEPTVFDSVSTNTYMNCNHCETMSYGGTDCKINV